jgi:hypothetical protein
MTAVEILTELKRDPGFLEFNSESDHVIDKWRPIFLDPENVTADQFREFLKYSVNKHWTGIHRQAGKTVAEMGKLRGMLKSLASNGGIVDRFNFATGQDISGVCKQFAWAANGGSNCLIQSTKASVP